MNIKVKEKVPDITDEVIIKLWKTGLTIKQISKQYMRSQKQKGTKITELEAQKHVEPLIFEYQTNLMRS